MSFNFLGVLLLLMITKTKQDFQSDCAAAGAAYHSASNKCINNYDTEVTWSIAYDNCVSEGTTYGYEGRLLTQIDSALWTTVVTKFGAQIGGSNPQRWIGTYEGTSNTQTLSNIFWSLTPKTSLSATSITMPAGVTYEIDDNAAKCIRAYSSTSWKDASCTDTHGYFCEFTETTTTTSTSTTTTTPTTTSTAAVTPCPYGCQPGYSDWQSVGSCYKYIASSNIQTLAALACGLDLAALLVVDSAAEQLAVQSSISDSVWMGITYSGSSWQKPLLGGALSYTNWNSPAPASSLSTAYIDSTNSYKWSVGSVLTTAETVCEAKCLLAPLPGACNLNPCVNGNCTNGKLLGLFTCTCSAGYTGTVCNTEIDECDSSPCLNNGVCTDTFNGYNCTCLAAFSGTNCEVKLTTCDLQTSSEQKQRIAMFASQSVSSIVLLVALGILVIIFLILLDFSLERVFHMGQEISLWLAHITILFARTRTVLDAGAFCGADASGNPPKLSNVQCGLVAVWLHYLYLVHFAFLFMETLHNYTLYTYVFVLQPLLKRKFVLLLGLLGPLPIVALTAGIWFSDYVTEQTCWLNFSSVNFFFELLPALIMCAAGEICAEATGMVEYARNVMAKEEKRFSANTNSKGSILIVPVSLFAWILGMAAVFSKSLSLYTIVATLNIILAILMLFFHTFGNLKARWLLWKIFCSWCPKQKPRPKPTNTASGNMLNQGNISLINSQGKDSYNSLNDLKNLERKSSLIALVEDADRRIKGIRSVPSSEHKGLNGQTRKSSLLAIVEDAQLRVSQ